MLNNKVIPDVSLIIVTYNAEKFIHDCLISVKSQRYTSYETIVVDNNSIDNTVEIIKNHYPWVKLICSQENLGFTGGVNLAYFYSSGRYIALLNPDTKADSQWLSNLIHAMSEDEELGICASLMIKWGTNLVDTAGDGCTRAGKGFKIGHNEPAELYQENKEVFAACGGAALYRQDMIKDIGFFDQNFFLLHEDTDISFRANLAGWKCKYIHNAVVEHRVSASIGYKSSLAVYHSIKNSDQVWLKNMPGLLLFVTLPEKIISDIASFIYLGIIHRKFREYLKAKLYVSTNLAIILKNRKNVQNKMRISNSTLLKRLTSFWARNYFWANVKAKKDEFKQKALPGGD